MPSSDAVLELLDCVAKLSDKDQDLILRMVRLMARAPEVAQAHSKFMLQRLLLHRPISRPACVSDLEVIISYLEEHIAREPGETAYYESAHKYLM